MRDVFPEYFPPTAKDFDELWESSLVCFDANVLLHVLRFKQSSSNEIMEVIQDLGDRTWVPHQAAKEFLKNRHTVFLGLTTPYAELERKLDDLLEAFLKQIGDVEKKHREHPSLDFNSMKFEARKSIEGLRKKIQKSQKKHPTVGYADQLVERLSDLFSGKVGREPSDQQRLDWEKEAKERYAKKVPPGYMDQDKPDGGYGDLFVWKQMIEKAKDAGRSIIYVTDDTKEDWWHRVQGQTIGPRPELREEFGRESGQGFFMYTLSNYLTQTNERGSKVSAAAIQEAEAEAMRSNRLRVFLPTLSADELTNYPSEQIAKIIANTNFNYKSAAKALLASKQLIYPQFSQEARWQEQFKSVFADYARSIAAINAVSGVSNSPEISTDETDSDDSGPEPE